MRIWRTKLALVMSMLPVLGLASGFNVDKASISAGTQMTIVEAEKTKARIFGFVVGVSVEDEIAQDLKFFFNVEALLETGSNEVVGTVSEYEPVESIGLHSGGMIYSPSNYLTIKAGALNQEEHHSPLLIGSTAFTAVQEKIGNEKIYLKATQAIPSNNQLNKRLGSVDDGNPYFGIETLGLQYGERTKLKVEVSHFAYKDLSNKVALISRELGNSVGGIADSSKFLYGFNGTNSIVNLKHTFLSGYNMQVGGEYLFNNDAPDERNSGYLTYMGLGTGSLEFQLEHFRNESDTSPGFYNSKNYGHSNRVGNSLGVIYKGSDLQANIKYTKANVLENDGFVLTDIEILTFSMVKNYEI